MASRAAATNVDSPHPLNRAFRSGAGGPKHSVECQPTLDGRSAPVRRSLARLARRLAAAGSGAALALTVWAGVQPALRRPHRPGPGTVRDVAVALGPAAGRASRAAGRASRAAGQARATTAL